MATCHYQLPECGIVCFARRPSLDEGGGSWVSLIPEDKRLEAGVHLRPVKVLMISPSESIERIAGRHVQELPRMLKFVLGG